MDFWVQDKWYLEYLHGEVLDPHLANVRALMNRRFHKLARRYSTDVCCPMRKSTVGAVDRSDVAWHGGCGLVWFRVRKELSHVGKMELEGDERCQERRWQLRGRPGEWLAGAAGVTPRSPVALLYLLGSGHHCSCCEANCFKYRILKVPLGPKIKGLCAVPARSQAGITEPTFIVAGGVWLEALSVRASD